MSHYTKQQLKGRINAGIKNKLGVLTDVDETLNQVVRAVLTDVDLRSTRRMVTIQPGIFDQVYVYPAPDDIKAMKLLSLRSQADQGSTYYPFNLIPYEQFNTKLGYTGRFTDYDMDIQFRSNREPYTVAFDDLNGVRRMMIAAPVNGRSQTLSSMDVVVGTGTQWAAFGGATNVVADPGNRLYGTASIKYDIDATPVTTAGLQNAVLTPFSISNFLASNCSVFVAAYLSNASDITDMRIRIGVDGANYYEMVVTSTHVNTNFAEGWNVLRFDVSTRTTVGTVDPDNLSYLAVFMTKLATKVSQTSFRFDHIVITQGDVYEVRYYSRFGWQSVAGVWLEDSTADDDTLNADSDEFELFVSKGIEMAGLEVDEADASVAAATRYQRGVGQFLKNNPSEALVETNDYMAQYFI